MQNQRESLGENRFTPYQIFLVALLTTLQFTIVLSYTIISPLGDMMMKDLRIDTTQFGLLVSGYAFGACVSGILAASYADRFDRKKFLIFFYIGFLIGLFICGVARSYPILLFARTITGVFGGVINSIALAIVADMFAIGQRGRVMGFIQMAFAVSQIIGIPIGLIIANNWGWNSTFIVIGAFSILVGIIIQVKMQPLKPHKSTDDELLYPLQRLWSIIRKRGYFAGFLLVMLVSIGGAMIMPFTAAFLINNVLIPQEELPLLYLISGVASIFIMIYIGKLSDKYSKKQVFLVGAIITVLMTTLFTNLGPTPLWLVIVINIILLGGINGRLIPTMALNTAVPTPHDRGGYISICSAFQQLANAIGAFAAGVIIIQDGEYSQLQNFDKVGYIVSAIAIICVFLIHYVAKHVQRQEEQQTPHINKS